MWYKFEMYVNGNVWHTMMIYAFSENEAWSSADDYARENGYEDFGLVEIYK